MAEKTTRRKAFEKEIPEEVRQHVRAAREEMRESINAFLPPGIRRTPQERAQRNVTRLAQFDRRRPGADGRERGEDLAMTAPRIVGQSS